MTQQRPLGTGGQPIAQPLSSPDVCQDRPQRGTTCPAPVSFSAGVGSFTSPSSFTCGGKGDNANGLTAQ